jgi:dihydroflavonol-4-reductase
VIVNPSYIFGVPVDPSEPGKTSNRIIGNYLRGRLPAVVDGETNAADVRDVAAGHLMAAERGHPGERYVLGGHDVGWVELIERVARLSGVSHPILVLPRETARAARLAETLRMPQLISAEAFDLMAQNWRFSSRKAKRELGYRVRALNTTLRDTIGWYRELIEEGAFDGSVSPMSVAAAGVRVADRIGLLGGLRTAERYVGRRLVGGG